MDKYMIYNQRKANPTTIWLVFIFLGWSYGSLGQIGLQILYYLTLGGIGCWTIIRLFTLNGSIRNYNRNLALQLGFNEQDLAAFNLI